MRQRRRSRSLRARIIGSTALVSALAMAAMIGAVVLVLNAVGRDNVDSTLEDRLAVISAGIESDASGPERALAGPDDSVDDSTWLFDARGQEVDGPHVGQRVQQVAQSLATVRQRTSVTRRERHYLAGPVRIRGVDAGEGVLVVSQSLEPYESTRTEVLLGLLALGLLVTAGSTALAAWTVSRTLAPVDSMAARAEEWSERELDARFADPDAEEGGRSGRSRNEIAHLGQTLNVLLDRVAGALRGEQRLTSELAHELRTPLTGLRGELELALMGEPDAATRQRLETALALSDQMGTTITTLLDLARGQGRDASRATLEEVVSAALRGPRCPGTEPVQVRVGQLPQQVRVGATAELAVRALSPLVDNALRHAGSRVDVSVATLARSVRITVSDDGPGVPEESGEPDGVFLPGARSADSPGAGLGLPLARRVARSLGGEVTLTSHRSPTSFTLTLPRP